MKKFAADISAEKAFLKIKQYCAYQERSHFEVKEKLYSYKLHKKDAEQLLARLIEENFLNEERFAKAFARGKFNLKNWGKRKIEYELKQKRVSEYNIRKALQEIDVPTYKMILHKLALKKWNQLKGEQYIVREVKTINYLLQKGFENNAAREVVKEIKSNIK